MAQKALNFQCQSGLALYFVLVDTAPKLYPFLEHQVIDRCTRLPTTIFLVPIIYTLCSALRILKKKLPCSRDETPERLNFFEQPERGILSLQLLSRLIRSSSPSSTRLKREKKPTSSYVFYLLSYNKLCWQTGWV